MSASRCYFGTGCTALLFLGFFHCPSGVGMVLLTLGLAVQPSYSLDFSTAHQVWGWTAHFGTGCTALLFLGFFHCPSGVGMVLLTLGLAVQPSYSLNFSTAHQVWGWYFSLWDWMYSPLFPWIFPLLTRCKNYTIFYFLCDSLDPPIPTWYRYGDSFFFLVFFSAPNV